MTLRVFGTILALFAFVATSSPQDPSPTLQVYTKPIEPFSFQREDKAVGFSIDLWEHVARELGVKYEIHWVKTVGDLIDALQAKQADVAIAAITISSERQKVVDFSTPYYQSGLGILVKAQGKGPVGIIKETFGTSFVLKVLLVLFGLLIASGHLVWLFERNHNPDQFPRPYLEGVWEATWWAISTILSGGCDAKGPVALMGRLVGAFWMLVCIIVITYFTAALTTVMTVNQLTSDISGPNDLPGKKVATVRGTTAEKYLLAHGVKVTAFEKIDEAYEALERHDVVAVVYDEPILSYHVKNAGASDEQVVGLFERQNYGIGLQDGSPYRKRINLALLKLSEDGVLDELRAKWFGSE